MIGVRKISHATYETPDLERQTRATLQLLVPKYPALKAFIVSVPESAAAMVPPP